MILEVLAIETPAFVKNLLEHRLGSNMAQKARTEGLHSIILLTLNSQSSKHLFSNVPTRRFHNPRVSPHESLLTAPQHRDSRMTNHERDRDGDDPNDFTLCLQVIRRDRRFIAPSGVGRLQGYRSNKNSDHLRTLSSLWMESFE